LTWSAPFLNGWGFLKIHSGSILNMAASKNLHQLREQFAAENGFLLSLRTELIWNKEQFSQLVALMQQYLETTEHGEQIDRWVAEGFWFTESFVKDWISHPDFPKHHPLDYYAAAIDRLHDLSHWLFFGESPMGSGTLKPFAA
jgi:hypothetical protein